jgi:predicted O-linked N-acetylglucosamine transferase (SPINDLY family)
MGVPLITLAGTRHSARVGASLLQAVGLDQLIAQSPQDYIKIAASLARSPQDLALLKSGLRQKLLSSPLCDAPSFARKMEDTFHKMLASQCPTRMVAPTHMVAEEGLEPPTYGL